MDAGLPGLRLPAPSLARRADLRRRAGAHRAHDRERVDDPAARRSRPTRPSFSATPSPIPTPATPMCSRRWALPAGPSGASTRPMPSICRCRHAPTTSSGTFGAFSRVLRMLLQSAVLGLGAYLTIIGELSAGAIIACSVASTRALAPVDLAIGNWKNVVAARGACAAAAETVVALENGDRADAAAGSDGLAQGGEDHGRGAHLRARAGLSEVEFELEGRLRRSASSAPAAAARPRWCGLSPASGRPCAARPARRCRA